ncbi:haloacetate dehalogenase [Natronocella acetinitrilica]|uniref:Haloacetate dehalogenase n=1 Tax=Natronocella acetinitrilica TaxID=414046 RepID=A0AAE3KEX6_9GAMM|nr:alpha/beta hydrolase [Natronocella acetinitrilica]MCP1673552.1 haloacetate dehalogenase [Natronocella acetinitrilica]
MFEGFAERDFTTGETPIHYRIGGDGPPLVLLHGYPQTHMMWHAVAPLLAETHTVICPDLRGYGASGRPPSDASHTTYSKRAMGADIIDLMDELGYRQFKLAGHDRGGRVAHRLALDHPHRLEGVAVLDIVPTLHLFETLGQAVATGYYHWLFLIQPDGLPERLIGNDPAYYCREKLRRWSHHHDAFAAEAVDAYVEAFCRPDTIHATCEDYRAGATIDLEHHRADGDKLVEIPMLALWGLHGLMEKHYDVLGVWRRHGHDVTGEALDCGHFLPEEAPQDTARALRLFFN